MAYKINFINPQSRTHPYLYRCRECGKEEILERTMSDMSEVHCSCGGECFSVINSAPTVSLDPISGDFVGATDKWVKHREQKMKQEKKNLENHGTTN